MSTCWLKTTSEQLKSITSKDVNKVTFYYWLNQEEKVLNNMWKDIDETLSKDVFKSLTGVYVACVYREENWRYSKNFDRTDFPDHLPKLHTKGILNY